MKQIISSIILIVSLISCSDKKSNESTATVNDTSGKKSTTIVIDSASVDELLAGYLDLKNELASDNAQQAAASAKSIGGYVETLNNQAMSASQKTLFEEVKENMKEHSTHIADNASKIDHQREHFDMLSTDMLDLVKSFPVKRTVYIDHCPMYNEKKGAFWLSEVKEIKNPYYGKEMLECGIIKEEIKSGK